MNTVFAAAQGSCVTVNGVQVCGPTGTPTSLGDIFNRVIGILVPIAGLVLLGVLIWGGYDFLLSQGNPDKVKSAQAKITSGIIGFALLVISYFAVKLIAFILGIQGGIF